MGTNDRVLVGHWAFEAQERGLTVCHFNPETGRLTPEERFFPQCNVGCIHVEQGLVLIADECDGRHGSNAGSGYVLSARETLDGRLELCSEIPSLACSPSYLCLDRSGRYVLAAHHGLRRNHATRAVRGDDGSWRTETVYDQAPLMLFRLQADGSLGPLCDVWTERPGWPDAAYRPHLHFVGNAPNSGLYIVTDPGTDGIFTFRVDEIRGRLELLHTLRIEKGRMPRYAAFHPQLPLFFANNERGSLVNSFRYDADNGMITRLASCDQLCADIPACEPSDLRISPDGSFLYGAVRGAEALTAMSIQTDGALQTIQNLPCGGRGPRGLCISPDGRFLLCANQVSQNVAVFRIEANGQLSFASSLKLDNPGCLAFWPPQASREP